MHYHPIGETDSLWELTGTLGAFQDEYLTDISEKLWANPDCVGFSIWQMNDGRTRERFNPKAVSAFFGGSVAGVFDQMRRPKQSAKTVKRYFSQK